MKSNPRIFGIAVNTFGILIGTLFLIHGTDKVIEVIAILLIALFYNLATLILKTGDSPLVTPKTTKKDVK